ncbi:hypothetical protein D3Z58_22690 [Clostridiaceae bacterium]|nr:hypothetical protein [Clostridiaceae bacterium]
MSFVTWRLLFLFDNISSLVMSTIFLLKKILERRIDKQIAGKCLDLWDIMFEKQLGTVRQISDKLMNR